MRLDGLRLGALLPLLLLGCAGGTPAVSFPTSPPRRDAAALDAAAEAFYAASDAEGLRRAVQAARAAGPDTAIHHELAAALARLELKPDQEIEHLLAALLDPESDDPLVHLERLTQVPWSIGARRQVAATLAAVVDHHPDAELRGLAASELSWVARSLGDAALEARAVAAAGLELPLALIGPWDNDQGKGFSNPLPPEAKIDLSARYDGALLPIEWRRAPVAAPSGGYDLGSLFTPRNWAVAYAVGAFEVSETGRYALRVVSTDPFKLWVDGVPVYAQSQVGASSLEPFVLPLELGKGVHRVLVKSAQRTGSWRLRLRVTAPDGSPSLALSPMPVDAEPTASPAPVAPLAAPALVQSALRRMTANGRRRAYHAVLHAGLLGADTLAVSLADPLVKGSPGALMPRVLLADRLLRTGERERSADLVGALDAAVGLALPHLRLDHAELQRGLKRLKRARELLESARDEHPESVEVWLHLARYYQAEGWTEDRCRALDEAIARRPDDLRVLIERADCRSDLGYRDEARATMDSVLDALPGLVSAAQWHRDDAIRLEALERAERLAARLAELLPHQPGPLRTLAELRRRRRDRAGAERALQDALAIDPDSPQTLSQLARLAYEHGDRELAIQRWEDALARNPDDAKLAQRLAVLVPRGRFPWEKDVPSEEQIEAMIQAAAKVKPEPGADVLDVLDHEVMLINPDGSASCWVTSIQRAVNDAGRDGLTQHQLRPGRRRLTLSYAIGPDGRRAEAASVRGSSLRFRGLKAGSTVVVQYRVDEAPAPYLARHVARTWWFQSVRHQGLKREWIVWSPKGTKFHEQVVGEVAREARTEGEHDRVAWRTEASPPLLPEPNMPTSLEVLAHVSISSVPGWSDFVRWEEALLDEAFRSGPEIDALAARLFEGATEPAEKVKRIHEFLMREIRYQQDYEDTIAGVKPHAAPQVLERGYGDCKDKAVLFVTLAQKVGVDVHFALVRTRPKGPIVEAIPMQQFDHAIVYVPAQPGIETGRFYDPTADLLDIETLRADDVGTRSLVFDPETKAHEFRDIPYQTPEAHAEHIEAEVVLGADGKASGTVVLRVTGSNGSAIRRIARNERQFEQLAQIVTNGLVPGASVKAARPLEVDDLRQPASAEFQFSSTGLARKERDTLRLSALSNWKPKGLFALPSRKYALVVGTPNARSTRTTLRLPPGAKLESAPDPAELESPCFVWKRTVTPAKDGASLVVVETADQRCERIEPADYAAHRALAERVLQQQQQEIVVKLPGARTRI
jgi:tetratricopeptide (TPR) repeat protein